VKKSRLVKLSIISVILMFVFLLFSMGVMAISGGSAIGGKIENGKHFVYSAQGSYIETSAITKAFIHKATRPLGVSR
jgi:hypothetical protein